MFLFDSIDMSTILSFLKYTILVILFWCIAWWSQSFAIAPSFDDNFAKYMTDTTPDQYGRVEAVFSFSDCIKRDQSIVQNVKNLFYPNQTVNPKCSTSTWGLLRDVVRIITFGLIFLFVVITGMKFILEGAEAGKKAWMNLIYIWYWAFLVYWSVWILWFVLNIENSLWSSELVSNLENNLFLQILSFFKVLAFFIAIVMMVITGFKMMSALDKEDKIKEWKKGIVNIIVALVFIKIIDYIFYIAQTATFAAKAGALILSVAKILGWILWIVFVLALTYGWYTLFFSGWDEKAFKKTKSILINILMISLVLFFFLLIIYQIFNEFA